MEILAPLALLGIGLLTGGVIGYDLALQRRPVPAPVSAPAPLPVIVGAAGGWSNHGGRAGGMPPATFAFVELEKHPHE